jgi:hypothetical protein
MMFLSYRIAGRKAGTGFAFGGWVIAMVGMLALDCGKPDGSS